MVFGQGCKVEEYRPEVPGPWWWRLKDANLPEDVELGNLGNVGENPQKTLEFGQDESKVAKLSDLGNLGTNGCPSDGEWGEV